MDLLRSFGICLLISFTYCSCNNDRNVINPSQELLDRYSMQTPFSDPGEYAYLYNDLPISIDKICDLIKKQLIHPFEARQMKDLLPEGRYIEDGDFPTIYEVLAELQVRDSNGLTSYRKPENRMIIACYHHGLLFASILRERGIPVRLRAGFARYFEKQAKVRFGHVICEVWDVNKKQWIWVDPDRNYVNVSDSQFELPADAWQNFRKNKLPDVTYTSSLTEGTQALLHILLLDHAFTLSNERSYWHTPDFLFTDDFSLSDLDASQIEVFDQIAAYLNQPAIELIELQKLYDDNPFIHQKERGIDSYYEKMSGKSLENLSNAKLISIEGIGHDIYCNLIKIVFDGRISGKKCKVSLKNLNNDTYLLKLTSDNNITQKKNISL